VKRFDFRVNGVARQVEAWPLARLLDVLREDLHLTGTKEGCGEGECGACSVMLGGRLINSCLVPIAQVAGQDVTTIEGLRRDGEGWTAGLTDGVSGAGAVEVSHLHPVQGAFISHGGAQCGICTPGMILATVELLEKHPEPDEAQIREGLSGNLCRCTGYMKIFDAVRESARQIVAAKAASRWVEEGGTP